MTDYLRHPRPLTVSPFWADLCATLDAHGLMYLLDEQLAKPALGHPKFAAARARCRVTWLESELAVARLLLADAERRAA